MSRDKLSNANEVRTSDISERLWRLLIRFLEFFPAEIWKFTVLSFNFDQTQNDLILE